MTRIFSIFLFTLLLFGCNDNAVECKSDVFKDVTIQTCYGIDESILLGGGDFTFVNHADTIHLTVSNLERMGNKLDFRRLLFSKGGRFLDAANFIIKENLIHLAIVRERIDSLTNELRVDTHRMKINGENEDNSPLDEYDPCRFSLRSKEKKQSHNGLDYYRIELKHPNDYHGEQLICEGVEKVDLWMTNLEHPKIVALQYKGDIYTLRD